MTKPRFHSLAAAVAVAALATAAGSSAAQPATTTLSLMSVQTSFVPVPPINKNSPPQIGGRMFFQDVLYNHAPQFGQPAGARVGTAEIVCTLVSNSHLECVVTAHLPGGGSCSRDRTRSAHTTRPSPSPADPASTQPSAAPPPAPTLATPRRLSPEH